MVVVVMMVVVAMVMVVVVVMLIVVMFVVVLMVMVVVLVMVMVVVLVVVVMVFIVVMFHLFYPRCRRCHLVEHEAMGVEQALEVYVAVVARNDFCLWLYGTYYLTHMQQLVSAHLRCLVQQYGVAELYLLYDQIFEVFVANLLLCQRIAALKLVAHTQRVDHRHDAVETWHAVFDVLRTERGE